MATREEEQQAAYCMAAEYLAGAKALRDALGIPFDETLEPHLLGMGEHNINFWFQARDGRKFVLRINVTSQPFHKNQVLYEYDALVLAQPSGCTPKPLFIDYSSDAPGKGIIVESFCEGEQLNFDSLRPGDIRCAIQMMADVHAVRLPAECSLFKPTDPLQGMFDECVQRYDDYLASKYREPRIVAWVDAFMEKTRAMMRTMAPPEDCDHIINTETLPSHFLIPADAAKAADQTGEKGRFCAAPGSFVDWERPVRGEVAQDVAYFVSPTTTFWDSEFLFPASDIPMVLEEYWQAVDGRFDPKNFTERFGAWRMMTALKSTTWCVQAMSRYNEDSDIHTTEKTAGKLPVYLSDDFMQLIATECFHL